MRALAWVGAALVAACYDAKCPDSPPSDGGIVEVFVDGSEDAAASPCGKACENLERLGCPEGKPSASGVSCYRVCLRAFSLRTTPLDCWAKAADVVALRACGAMRCER